MMDKDIDKILTAKSEQVKKLQEIVKKAWVSQQFEIPVKG